MKIRSARHRCQPLRPSLAAGVLMLAASSAAALADTRCYSEWSDAAPIVARERLLTARDVQEMAREQLGGDIVRIMLCRDADRFVYRAVVRRDDGRISTWTVGAAATTQAADDPDPKR
jgi:uncharacterized membrane protein YkoI